MPAIATHVDRVIVYPRSGYANRLQACASASAVADELGAGFSICWQSQPVAGSDATEIFSDTLCTDVICSPEQVRQSHGIDIDGLPRYLHYDRSANVISLAGHDHGEQHYMSRLSSLIDQADEGVIVVIIAGGHFYLPHDGEADTRLERQARERRGAWYRAVQFHPDIETLSSAAIGEHAPFNGLHLRYSDRSHQAPTDRQIAQALESLAARSITRSLFIASDSAPKRDRWMREATTLGMLPWTVDSAPVQRSDPRSSHPALIDWRILGASESLIYFSESSFAHEAAVASGDFERSVGLTAHPMRVRVRQARHHAVSLASWPRRKLSLDRSV